MKPRKHAATEQVTARPRSLRDEALGNATEEGLSIEPEEMGQSFLRYATETPSAAEGVPELHADGAPPSDQVADGSHFSTDASIWENTAGVLLEQGGSDDLNEPLLPPKLGEQEEDEDEDRRGVVEVDLTANVIEEASLLDEESSVLGETVPKQPRTDDTGPDSRRAHGEEEGD
jgi:hypothetical protein